MNLRIARKVLKDRSGRYSFGYRDACRRRVRRADPEERVERRWYDDYSRNHARANDRRIETLFREAGLRWIRENS